MGYTHYLDRPIEFSREEFADWAQDCSTIFANLPEYSTSGGGFHAKDTLRIAQETSSPDVPPVATSEMVRFNGVGRDGDDNLGHETFLVPRVFKPPVWDKPDEYGRYFTFCKTERKPYDLVVCAVLIRLATRFPEEVRIESDGEVAAWEPARQLVEPSCKAMSWSRVCSIFQGI